MNSEDQKETSDSYVEGDDVYYTSGDLEGMLGVKRDLIRYYTNEYIEFLNPDKTKGGHLRYKGEDIATLRLIFQLLKTHSTAETKAILRDKDVRIVYANQDSENSGLLKLLMENDKYLISEITKYITELLMPLKEQLLLEQNKAEDTLADEVESLREENRKLKQQIEANNEQTNKKLDDILATMEKKDKKKGIFGIFK